MLLLLSLFSPLFMPRWLWHKHVRGGSKKKKRLKKGKHTRLSRILSKINIFFYHRFRNGLPLDTGNSSKFEGASVDRPSLLVKSASAGDAGEYACVLDNAVGRGVAGNVSTVEVLCEYCTNLGEKNFFLKKKFPKNVKSICMKICANKMLS